MYGVRDLYIILLVLFVVNFSGINKYIIWILILESIYVTSKISGIRQTYNMEIIYVARKFSGNRINFWYVKFLWSQERLYVAIPNMAVWERLACLAPDAPDAPDGWSFPDVFLPVMDLIQESNSDCGECHWDGTVNHYIMHFSP